MVLMYSMVFLFDKKNDHFYNMGKSTFELAEVIVWLSMSLLLVSYGFLHYRYCYSYITCFLLLTFDITTCYCC